MLGERVTEDAVPRNLIICLDGTSNGPETGATNVSRMYDIAQKSDDQLCYYDAGVGTMGARGALTLFGQTWTKAAGLIAGFGLSENIQEAYAWLSQTYRAGDAIYVFGFSRGAYTARALAGMLRKVGLVRPGLDNLAPYAFKLYEKNPGKPGKRGDAAASRREKRYWMLHDEFLRQFGNPDFPLPNSAQRQVRFLGVWDTVQATGWLNVLWGANPRIWPFTRRVDNVQTARHALAIDERRRPYSPSRFMHPSGPKSMDHREMWFAGTHSDVGGRPPHDHQLSDIALAWMVKEAQSTGFLVDHERYASQLRCSFDEELPAGTALGRIHQSRPAWLLAGGWRVRPIPPGDLVHPSVRYRIEHTADSDNPYRPPLH
ncbi:hypothetical protein A5722_16990 [Mycobacterium vulneris]|nr:hypothetical protein A5722_16990 [Mycolicibacterium vulneris]OCB65578.1 hypothetical protein A5729_15825 [Mycolicibacterium vulneris]